MEKEASMSIVLAVNVLLVSWILSLVVVFTQTGQGFSRFILDKITTTQMQTANSQIDGINNYGKPIPVTTVYKMCEEVGGNLKEIGGWVMTKKGRVDIHEKSDLKKIFGNKVNVIITKNIDGSYSIGITDPT